MAQGGCDAAAWLADEEILRRVPDRIHQALVFVAPDDKIDEVVQELLRDVVVLSMLGPM